MLSALVLAFVLQSLPPVPVPAENPSTPQKELLGKVLFWDEQLSSTDTVACGTCHVPSVGGVDPRSVALDERLVHFGPDGIYGTGDDRVGSPGVPSADPAGLAVFHPTHGLEAQVTARRSFSMINSAFFPQINWEGAAGPDFVDPESGVTVSTVRAGLESQALGPILSEVEMAHSGRTWDDVRTKLENAVPLRLAEDLPPDVAAFVAGKSYPDLFALAFPTEPNPDAINARRIAQALASYQRSLISDQTPYDLWAQGDVTALTPQEDAGRAVFNGAGNCVFCHPPPLFSDFSYQNTGVRPSVEDLGRELVTGLSIDRGRFRTTGLRNVGLRTRYFHNGQFETLEEVVDFYVRGGDFTANQSTLIVPLNLSQQQRADLIEFLRTGLTDPRVAAELPPFDRPTLFTESARVPVFVGAATPGTGGVAPRYVAEEPPTVGNPGFTLGVEHSTAGRPVLLAYSMQPSPVPGGTPIFGALVHLGLTPATVLRPQGLLNDDGTGGGWASISTPLPANPGLVGATFWSQWFVLDDQAPGGLAATRGLRVTLF